MRKVEHSPFDPLIKWFFPKLLPFVPRWLSANMITIIGLSGSVLSAVCLYLSRYAPLWCFVGALMVWLHWFADTLDGEVARARRPSKLGFYLDHFGDALSVGFIALGVFLTPRSHLAIGAALTILYLLLFIHGLIKAELTRVMELPAFGPTEIHFCLVLLIVAQGVVGPGQVFDGIPLLTGDEGLLVAYFSMQPGFTLIDHAGLVILPIMLLILIMEISQMCRTLLGDSNRAPDDLPAGDKNQ